MNYKKLWLSLAFALLIIALLLPASALAFSRPGPGGQLNAVGAESEMIAGPLVSKPDQVFGPWIIGARTVIVLPGTRFQTPPAEIKLGDEVQATVRRQFGQLVADDIRKLADAAPPQTQGVIVEMAADHWMVGAVKVLLTPATEVMGSTPDVGDMAAVWGESTAGGLVAARILVMDAREMHFRGVIKSMGKDVWVFTTPAGDQEVMVNDATVIEGTPDVGDTANVSAVILPDGLLATKIAVAEAGGETHFVGVIKEMKPDSWVITVGVMDKTVGITADTLIEGDTPDVGDMAAVWAVNTDAGLVATNIYVTGAAQGHFAGVIKEMNADNWVITLNRGGDRKVMINADTKIEGDVPNVGDYAEVWAASSGEDIVASRIVVHEAPPDMEFAGRIKEINPDNWLVGRQRVGVTKDTVIEGDKPDVGDMARVWAKSTPAGAVATRIVVHDMAKGARPVILRGTLEAKDGNTWTVAGQKVVVMEDTQIVGDPKVGDEVMVVGALQEDGSLAAYGIFAVGPVDANVYFSGFITKITEPVTPADPEVWTVESSFLANGQLLTWEVLITSATTLAPANAEPAVGSWVKGVGTKTNDGKVLASMVNVLPPPRVPFGGAIEQKPDPLPYGEWVINGIHVLVTTDTKIIGDPATWNGKAEGQGILQPGGKVKALVIGPGH